MLGASALGWPRGMVWGGRREEGSGWGTHVYLWRIHFDIWQNYYNYVKFKNKIKLIKKTNKQKNKDHFLHWDGMGGSIYIQQSKVTMEGVINYTSSVPILIVLPSCAISKLSLGIALLCSIPPRTKCVVSGSSTPSTDSIITSSNPETTAGITFTKTCYIFSFFGLRTQKSSISFFTCELMFIWTFI